MSPPVDEEPRSWFGPAPVPGLADEAGPRRGGGITDAEVEAVLDAGRRLAGLGHKRARDAAGAGPWFFISGRLRSTDGGYSTDTMVRKNLIAALGYPKPPGESDRTINVLVDSQGGSLDSAYRSVMYLRAYARRLVVVVPRRAKSASTLIALGADQICLSPFGELGPLDTQIPDPRNPAKTVSALDCYQSVDYVRRFGFATLSEAMRKLVKETEGRVPLSDLLEASSEFALGAISPLMQSVKALDFGGWGRSLRIGQRYAEKLLLSVDADRDRAARIGENLVYGYTHHLFPVDHGEAERMGLALEPMDKATYEAADAVVQACNGKDYVGFISPEEVERSRDEQTVHAPAQGAHDRRDGEASWIPKESVSREAATADAAHDARQFGESST